MMRSVVLAMAAACLGLAACTGDAPPPRGPLVVAVCPLSGNEASTGRDLRQGIELALDIVNQSHDLSLPLARSKGLPRHGGARLEVLFADSQSDPDTAARIVEDADARGAAAVMGCYASAVTEAASRRAEVLEIPFLAPVSTSPVLTRRGFHWFFRTTPDDAMFAALLFDFLDSVTKGRQGKGPGRADAALTVGMVYENGLWGTGVSREEMRQAQARGYAIAADAPYDQARPDLGQVLALLRAGSPSVVFQASYAADAVALMRAYQAGGFRPQGILAMDAGFIDPHFIAEMGPGAEHVFSREVFSLDLGRSKPLVREVNDLFHDRFGRDMSGNSARSLTGLLVLAEALDRAEGFAPGEVRLALAALDISGQELIMPWDGVRFDADTGQNSLGGGIVVQMLGGVFRTVWPLEHAAARPVWPMPLLEDRVHGSGD